ncbi:hypothetical protein OIU77_030480 [Salix suchowensis]|uniref:Late embryogenesis abundant protein LEA-2 subgroup domain-containing protein n=1 Tax=Salix suchowensis TaxID=1278906 RepID=A0ABQ9BCP5_9ROSI|nr:Water stress and hypersensitive response domain containing protein [Salix suchowensis]KAJ6381815.1 hypothetical protein OIU77_030480 [Salix suchowensis]
MTSKASSVPYTSLPSRPDSYPQNVIVLSYYHRPPNHILRRCLLFTTAILLLSASVYLLYPSDPAIQLSRIKLNHIRVNYSPELTLDASFSLTIKVENRDFFSLYYDSLVVSVGYRGRELGFVNSRGGKIRARRSSYVDAKLDLNGLEVIKDVFYLIQDLARGVILFDTNTQVEGDLGLLLFKIPINGRVSCQVLVNTNNQTVEHQDCYPQ